MRTWTAVGLFLATWASGCFVPNYDSCIGVGSGNAPLSDVLVGARATVVARVAEAFHDPLTGAPDGAQYASARGHWGIDDDGGAVGGVNFLGTGAAWLNESIVRDALMSLGLDPDGLEREDGGWPGTATDGFSVRYWQTFQGAWLTSVDASSLPDMVSQDGGYGHFTSIEVRDVRDLSRAQATVPNATAVAAAQTFLDCSEWTGYTIDDEHVGLGVFDDSIVRQVAVSTPAPGEHCDPTGGNVLVDAVNGDVLAFVPWGCA